MRKKSISIACILISLIIAGSLLGKDRNGQGVVGHTIYGSGPEKVIVMHDCMGDSENYRSMLPYLDTNAFTYAFIDVRGYGISRHLAGPYGVQQASQDAFALADELDWQFK